MNEQFQVSRNAAPSKNTRLTSWKEVAAYMGKAVRTVKRWEHQFGLPVRRAQPRRHVIFALPQELDAWVKHHQQFRAPTPHPWLQQRMQHQQLTNRLRSAVARLNMNRQTLISNLVRIETMIAAMKAKPNSSSD